MRCKFGTLGLERDYNEIEDLSRRSKNTGMHSCPTNYQCISWSVLKIEGSARNPLCKLHVYRHRKAVKDDIEASIFLALACKSVLACKLAAMRSICMIPAFSSHRIRGRFPKVDCTRTDSMHKRPQTPFQSAAARSPCPRSDLRCSSSRAMTAGFMLQPRLTDATGDD